MLAEFELYVLLAVVRLGSDVPGAEVRAEIFDVLGVQPLLGRTPTPEEARANAPVAVVSESFWRNHMNARPDVLGNSAALVEYREHDLLAFAALCCAVVGWPLLAALAGRRRVRATDSALAAPVVPSGPLASSTWWS